jgi:ABC-2 type transport system ATP-binding protein
MIVFDQVCKTFSTGRNRNPVVALKDVSFEWERGKIHGLVGPNGSGKTTSLHCLLHFLQPESGTITIDGLPPQDPNARGVIGYQSEIFYPYPHMTAYQCMEYFASLRTPHATDASVQQCLKQVGLWEDRDRKTGGFSKGMKQRLGLAQSMLHESSLIIWDEPTSGLDPDGRKMVADLIAEQKAKGHTMIISTHILQDVERCCDDILILAQGQVKLFSDLETLRQQHLQKPLEDIYIDATRNQVTS